MTWEGASLARVVWETQSWARWRLALQQDLPEPLMGSASSDTPEGVGWQDSQTSPCLESLLGSRSERLRAARARKCRVRGLETFCTDPRAPSPHLLPGGSGAHLAPAGGSLPPGSSPAGPRAPTSVYLPTSEDAVYPPAHSENLKCLLSIKKSDFTQFP